MARGRGGEREGSNRGGGGGGNKWSHGGGLHHSQDGGVAGGSERGRGRGRAGRGGRTWGNPNASHAQQQGMPGGGVDGGHPGAGQGVHATNQKPSMLQALTMGSGPPGLKPMGHAMQQPNGNPGQVGGNRKQDGKGSAGKGNQGPTPLQFGTMTPNFLPLSGGPQQPPPPSREGKPGSGPKDGGAPVGQQMGGKDAGKMAKGQQTPGGVPPGAQGQQKPQQMNVSPGAGPNQQVPSIVTPPHHHGGYPMNAAFLAAAQAQASARQQVEAVGVQGGFPGGVIPPQFRSPQGIHAFQMQQLAAQQAAAQQVGGPNQQQIPINPMNMNQMQQMMSQMQLDQRGLPPQVQLQAAQAAQMPRQPGMGQMPGGIPRSVGLPPQMSQPMVSMGGPGGPQGAPGGVPSAALAAIMADRARRKTKAIAIIDPDTHEEVSIFSPDKKKDQKKKEATAEQAKPAEDQAKPAPKQQEAKEQDPEPAPAKKEQAPPAVAEKKPIQIKDAVAPPQQPQAPPAKAKAEDQPAPAPAKKSITIEDPPRKPTIMEALKTHPVTPATKAPPAPALVADKGPSWVPPSEKPAAPADPAPPSPPKAEEAAEVAEAAEPEGASGPPWKYTKDFLLSFKAKHTKEPEGLEKSECTIHGQSGGPGFGHGFKHHGHGPPGSPMHGHHRRQGSEGGDEWNRRRGGKHHHHHGGHGNMSGLQGLMPGSRGKHGKGGAPGMGRHGGHHGGYNQGGNWNRGGQNFHGGKVELHKTESKYIVGQTQSEDPEEEKKQKEIKSVLNKLTPQNFDKLVLRLIDIKFTQERSLVGLIDQIFDKSLTEPTFCELYAQLCQSLRDQLPEFENAEDGKKVTFRRVLLNKCQEEFEKGDLSIKKTREDLDAVEKMKFDMAAVEAEAAKAKAKEEDKEEEASASPGAEKSEKSEDAEAPETPKTPKVLIGVALLLDQMKEAKTEKDFEKKKEKCLKEIRDEELKGRRRMLGNVIFIGQLYKHQMLTEKIMHKCIVEQLKNIENPEPESVECLCKLLTTIGGQIDQPKSKKIIDEYFRRLDQLSKNPALDSRIRFMVQDVIDLRYNSWRLRRKVEGPKLLAEVHKDAMQAMAPGGRGGRGGGRRDRDRGQDYGRDRGGGNYSRGSPRDSNQLMRDDFVEYNKRPQSGLSGRPNAMPTRLAPGSFLKPNFKNKSDGGRPGSSPGGRGSGKHDGPKGAKDHGDRPKSARPHASPGRAKASPADDAKAASDRSSAGKASGAPPKAAKPAMSEEETQKKAKGIIEEFHNLYDYKEVRECVKELKEKNCNLGLVLKHWLMDLLEGKKRSVDKFRKLLLDLGEHSLVTKEDCEFALVKIICTLEDLEIDVPKAPLIIAEVYGDLACADLASLSILGPRLTKEYEDSLGEKVDDLFGELEVLGQDFALLLHKSLIDRGAAAGPQAKTWTIKDVEQGFASAGIKLKPFAADKVEKYGCQAIFAHITYKRHVMQALAEGADPAFLAHWFDRHVDRKIVKSNSRLASETLADVLQRSLSELGTSTATVFPNQNDDKGIAFIAEANHGIHKLFNSLVDKGNLSAEFDCVLALQLIHHKFGAPKNLMARMLQDFYETDVLTEDAFNRWRQDNKDDTPGKVKAISDSTPYLTWLENEPVEED